MELKSFHFNWYQFGGPLGFLTKMDEIPFKDEITGLLIEEARAKVQPYNFKLRPMVVDGKRMMGTMDIDMKRLNVKVANGKVIQVMNVG